jgi:hypothetical protein
MAARRADCKAIDVSHGPGCPKNLLNEAMDSPNGASGAAVLPHSERESIGLMITLADITEEEFPVLELTKVARQE